MVIEYARNMAGLEHANSAEFDPDTPDAVIATMADQVDVVAGRGDLGGPTRLGSYPAALQRGSLAPGPPGPRAPRRRPARRGRPGAAGQLPGGAAARLARRRRVRLHGGHRAAPAPLRGGPRLPPPAPAAA